MDRICKIMLTACLNCDELTDAEAKFVESIGDASFLTEKQADILEEIYDRRCL